MKKTLNTDAITNELAGASAFFAHKTPQPKEENPTPVPPPPAVKEVATEQQVTNVPTNERTVEREKERRKIRHTFDIYDDQLFSLKELALERQKLFGKRELLGDLVQEALDAFITKERNKEG